MSNDDTLARDFCRQAYEIKKLQSRVAELEAACKVKDEALEKAKSQLVVGRRFLPTHGTFGEDGITNYVNSIAAVDHALAIQPGDALNPVVSALRFVLDECDHETDDRIASAIKVALSAIGEKT